MTGLVVTGFASLDHVVHLAGGIARDQTTRILRRDKAAWPRAGGCPVYVSMAAAGAGHSAAPLCWVGDDEAGRQLIGQCASAGLDTSGISVHEGRSSPVSILAYQPDGAVSCLYDPGFSGEEVLNDSQRRLIEKASHLCVTVGPGHLVGPILDHLGKTTRLYWAVKNDAASFDEEACRRLSARADVIFCNHAEQELITGTDAIRIVTHGAQGAEVVTAGGRIRAPAPRPIRASDMTGAGDTFAGGYIAAEMGGISDPLLAVRAGMAAAERLLTERQEA